MNHLLSILLTAILCATASAQTIKTLGYNTNGQVVANTTNALTFTNETRFGGGNIIIQSTGISWAGVNNGINLEELYLYFDGQEKLRWREEDIEASVPLSFSGTNTAPTTRANLGFSTNLNTLWTATNASNARSAVELGATWLTNTNVTNFRSAIGLGATNTVEFSTVSIGGSGQMFLQGAAGNISFYDGIDAEIVLQIPADTDPVVINGQWNDSNVRSNLGLPLSTLTNTSNVTMMRALSGSTNTNHPYSGSISVVGTNNTNTLVFSNGVLQSVQ